MKKTILIIIDNGHGWNTNGKCSPDKRLREYAYTREIAHLLYEKLTNEGYNCIRIVTETLDVSLKERVSRVNKLCTKYGAANCVLVSIHNNAIGNDGKWHDSCGFSVFVSKKASNNSKRLAEIFFQKSVSMGLKGNRATPKPDEKGRHFWTWSWRKEDITIVTDTACPAVLTENLFQDNLKDVDFLLSTEGKKAIVDLHFEALAQYIKEITG